MANITVIGGICADITGVPYSRLVERDSNPSRICMKAGGVGFNIACRLASLGHYVDMICVIGNDTFGTVLINAANTARVSLKHAVTLPPDSSTAFRSGVYICVNDTDGDMRIALSDLDATEAELTPSRIVERLPYINKSDACVIDGNLSQSAIECIAQNVTVPIFADPVSTKKALRFLPVLDSITAIKPNIYEARVLTGRDDPLSAARELVKRGVKYAFVSCGENGIYYADSTVSGLSAATRVTVSNTTGAGDAATAMLLHTILTGGTYIDSAYNDRTPVDRTPADRTPVDSAYAAAMANRFAAKIIAIHDITD